MDEPSKLLTADQAADILGISHHTLASWRRKDRERTIGLPWVEVGGQVRYRPEDVAAWLTERTKGAA